MNNLKFIFFAIVFFTITNGSVLAQLSVDRAATAFGILPEIRNVRLSPDGSKLLMLQEINDNTIIVTRDLTNPSAAANGIPIEEGHISSAEWANSETLLATVYGSRYIGLAQYNFLRDAGSMDSFIPTMVKINWQGDNSQKLPNIRFTVSAIADEEYTLLSQRDKVFKMNVASMEEQDHVLAPIGTSAFALDSNDVVRYAFGRGNSIWSKHIVRNGYYRKGEGSEWQQIHNQDMRLGTGNVDKSIAAELVAFAGFTPDPNYVIVYANDEGNRTALYRFNVDTGEKIEKIASHSKYDIIDTLFDNDENIDAYFYNGETLEMVGVSEFGNRLSRIFEGSFPDSDVRIINTSRDRSKLVLLVTSPTEPGTYYLLDLSNNSMAMLGYIYQSVDVDKLSPSKPIYFEARDGMEIPGFLTLPKAKPAENLPVIVYIRSEPIGRFNWGFDYKAQFLASLGYAVLQVNHRGAQGYGSDFTYAGFFELGGKMIEDINDGTRWLIDQGIADPSRICTMGTEYGGYAALQASVLSDNLYKCAIADDAYFNFDRYVSEWDSNYIETDDMDEKDYSPFHRVKDIHSSLLLIQSRQLEARVKFEYNRFTKNVEEQGTDIEVYMVEDLNINNRGNKLKRIGEFLAKQLKEQD